MFNPSETDKSLNVVFDESTPMHVQGSFRLSSPVWITAIPEIPVDCNNQAKFTVKWDVVLTNDNDVEFCVGVASNTDKKWYFTNTKSMNDRNNAQTFANFFNSGDVVRVILEREPQTYQCTMSATNLTMSKKDPTQEFMHQLMFTCSDPLFPVVCISSPAQAYTMQSVAQTKENETDEWDTTSKRFKVNPIKPPELTWKDWDWWFTRKNGGGKSKMTRKRLKKKSGNVTRRKFKRANMKTTRMRKRLHAHKKIKMNS
jgi:hypothetical protein